MRHEIQQLPPESQKKPLHWPGEQDFFQQVKSPSGGQQQYYPTPQKTVVPNPRDRWPEHKVSDKTANATKNVEREQWLTTYKLSHSGLGPFNPMKLENMEEKKNIKILTGEDDHSLVRAVYISASHYSSFTFLA